MNDQNRDSQESELPSGLAGRARQSLIDAGYRRLEQLTAISEAEIKMIHGIGPNDISLLRSALAARNLTLAGDQTAGGSILPDLT